MANVKISDLTDLAEAPVVGDLLVLVDVSDTTDSPDGTTKQNKAQYGLGSQVNAQTGTSYTVLVTDFRKLVTHTNASPIAVGLPQAGASFPAGWFYITQNRGAGAVTITPTTSTIDGASSLVLNQHEGAIIFSDGTNYFTFRGKTVVGGAGGAPADATYITQTSNGSLSAEQALSSLSTGLMRVATSTGAITSITDSAGLAANISDETGSGALVFATSPTLVTPVLGTPASGNLSNCTADGTDAVGFRNIPQNSKSTDYTTVLGDAGKHIYHPTSDDNPRTFTIDSNANVAYPIGTAITFINDQNTVTIAITSDTLVWAEDGSTGSVALAENGMATAVKVTSTRWIISGTGLS